MTTQRYALTKKSKQVMMWHIRRLLEQKGKTINEAVSSIAQGKSQRYAALWERMCNRAGLPFDYSNVPDKTAINHLRELYKQAFGSLPSTPLPPLKKVTKVHHTIALGAFRDVDGDTSPSDQSDQSDDQDSSVGSQQTSEADRINTTNTDTTIDSVARAGNQSPHWTVEGMHDTDLDTYAPAANQLANKVKQALLTDSKSRISRFRDSGNIDMQRLTDVATLSDVQNVYQRVTKGKSLNACVQVYIDTSGSMSCDGLLTSAVVTAGVLGTVFESLRVPYQLITFDRLTRIIKSWSSKWRNCDLRSVDSGGGTNAPRALRSGIPAMLNRREKRKIAIIATDGDLSSGHKLYNKGGTLTQWKKSGVELYAIGLGARVLCSDPSLPHIDFWNTVGVGNHVEHYNGEKDYRKGNSPYQISEGFNGGIDEVDASTLLPKLAAHIVDVFTEGRQTVRL